MKSESTLHVGNSCSVKVLRSLSEVWRNFSGLQPLISAKHIVDRMHLPLASAYVPSVHSFAHHIGPAMVQQVPEHVQSHRL